jgi:hypothetical protein
MVPPIAVEQRGVDHICCTTEQPQATEDTINIDNTSTQHCSCVMIPPFNVLGNLPPGVHEATWKEFTHRFGTTPHRRTLLAGLKAALEAFRAAGCRMAYIDGSFVTAKQRPNDYDGCRDIDGVDPDRLDPVLLTFDRGRAAQKAKYHREFFPAQFREGSSGTTFLEFFQIDKETGDQKGIIIIDLRELP